MVLILYFTHASLFLICIASLSNNAADKPFDSQANVCKSQECEVHENRVDGSMYSSERQENKALAVVPYNKDSLMPHQHSSREFTFAKHKIHVQQKWQDIGVAAVVWDAAVVLCEYLEENPGLVDGKTVLELGAGTGLAGIVAALLGGDVIVTERKEALENLKNIVTENVPSDTSIRAEVLDWTQELSNFKEHYDIILGADIIYIEETFSHLKRTLLHVCSEKTILLLSCKIRYDRDKMFLAILKENFKVQRIFHDSERDIVIYKCLLKS
ncbi:protein N-lysine methyltransferase METTL21A-like [Gigantopelta aegis]|uniref:protein N-lysine methyltransferase METTL21A-like n=1 Tax=Gigantopelta aegis TaxID=1735272 RepID=UPI001B889F64|nr:protein N-lysine methyltransferase METTL21A-like [Gigantopelta aegis]